MTETVQKRITKACSGRYVEGRRGTGRKRKAILRITQIGDSVSAMEEKKIPL